MPSIAQSTRIRNTSSMNLLVAGGIIVLIIGLFFVPEFVVQDELDQGSTQIAGLDTAELPLASVDQSTAGELVVDATARASLGSISDSIVLVGEDDQPLADDLAVGDFPPATEELSPLERVSALLQGNESFPEDAANVEELELEESEEATAEDDPVFSYTEEQLIEELVANTALEFDYIVPDGPLTWKMVRSPEGSRLLKKTRRVVRRLGNKMDKDFKLSKLALKEYESAISLAMNSTKHDVNDVKRKIEKLDLTVTAAFQKESAPPSERLQWADVYVGPYLQSRFAAEKKMTFKTELDPLLRISKLKIRQVYSHHGVFNPDAKVGLKMIGRIKGNHIKTIEAYRNGRRIKRLALNKRADDSGYRKFVFKQMREIKGSVYTFKVTDIKDRVYERSYSFYPRVRAFKWNGHTDGRFNIPFGENDPDLDKFFLLGYNRADEPVQEAPTFISTGLATF